MKKFTTLTLHFLFKFKLNIWRYLKGGKTSCLDGCPRVFVMKKFGFSFAAVQIKKVNWGGRPLQFLPFDSIILSFCVQILGFQFLLFLHFVPSYPLPLRPAKQKKYRFCSAQILCGNKLFLKKVLTNYERKGLSSTEILPFPFDCFWNSAFFFLPPDISYFIFSSPMCLGGHSFLGIEEKTQWRPGRRAVTGLSKESPKDLLLWAKHRCHKHKTRRFLSNDFHLFVPVDSLGEGFPWGPGRRAGRHWSFSWSDGWAAPSIRSPHAGGGN